MGKKIHLLLFAVLFFSLNVHAEDSKDFIRKWLIIGPFPNPPNKEATPGQEHVYDHTPPCVGLDTDYLTEHGGETKIVPEPGMTHTKKDGTKVKWFEHKSDYDKIVFRKIITKKPNMVGYAFTKIYMKEAGKYLLALGSDEGVCIWVNGKKVHYKLIKRSIREDDDLVRVTLKKGENRILVKVEQGWGGWGFMLRVVPKDEVFTSLETDVDRLNVKVFLRKVDPGIRQQFILASKGKDVGSVFLDDIEKNGVATGTITFPFPKPGDELGNLDMMLDGKKIGEVETPSFEKIRANTFQWQIPHADPGCVFHKKEFPKWEFEKPYWITHLIGPYKFSTKYYDADYKEVSTPDKPGRYGAVVEIIREVGEPVKKYITLFRQPEEVKWWELKWKKFSETLPEGMGIDPKVVRIQEEMLAEHLKWGFVNNLYKGQGGAVLLAGLYETSPEDPPAVERTNPWSRNAAWWIGLKQKLGLLDTKYLVYLPKGYHKDEEKRWPFILFLHGRGERGSDVQDVKRSGIPKLIADGNNFPFIIVSPQCSMEDGSWQPKRLELLLDKIAEDYRVDPKRIYCTGLSMGGFGTWRMAQEFPDRFAAIAPVCGGADPRDVERIKDIPTWVFHGAKDDAVPLKQSQEMVDALKKLGANPKFTVYPNLYHNSWSETYDNPELYQWLLKQNLAERKLKESKEKKSE
jgi:predicted esterase